MREHTNIKTERNIARTDLTVADFCYSLISNVCCLWDRIWKIAYHMIMLPTKSCRRGPVNIREEVSSLDLANANV